MLNKPLLNPEVFAEKYALFRMLLFWITEPWNSQKKYVVSDFDNDIFHINWHSKIITTIYEMLLWTCYNLFYSSDQIRQRPNERRCSSSNAESFEDPCSGSWIRSWSESTLAKGKLDIIPINTKLFENLLLENYEYKKLWVF